MKYVIGLLGLAAFFAIAIAQIAAGYAGISHGIGPLWALTAVFAAVLLRFTPPIVIGAFFGAMQVWGWHWPLALMFTLPGFFFMLPGSIPAIFSLTTEGASKLTRATPIGAEH
jgi:hypothetical protein